MSQCSWLPEVPESLVKLKIRCGFFPASFLLPMLLLAVLFSLSFCKDGTT